MRFAAVRGRTDGSETAPGTIPWRRLDLRVLVEEPAWILAEDAGEHGERVGGRRALARFHHAQIGHRGRAFGIHLHAARGQFVERESVALAERAQLRAQQMSLSNQAGHDRLELSFMGQITRSWQFLMLNSQCKISIV